MKKQGWIETYPATPANLPCARGPFDEEEEDEIVWIGDKPSKKTQREIAEAEGDDHHRSK